MLSKILGILPSRANSWKFLPKNTFFPVRKHPKLGKKKRVYFHPFTYGLNKTKVPGVFFKSDRPFIGGVYVVDT